MLIKCPSARGTSPTPRRRVRPALRAEGVANRCVVGVAAARRSLNRSPDTDRAAGDQRGPSAAVAYLLWFFLGLFSAHRFYLGRVGTALLQICSYFILVGFVWWLIDAFLIPDMLREKRAQLRKQLVVGAGGANPYAHLSSYRDPSSVS